MTGLLIGPGCSLSNDYPSGGGGGGYSANAVRFDGTNDDLRRGAQITGLVDGQVFTTSFWFNHKGKDADAVAMFFHGTANRFRISRLSKKWHFECRNAADTTLWEGQTVASYDTVLNPGWHHIIFSISLGTPTVQIYVDDAVDQTNLVGPVTGTVNFPFTNWGVGATSTGVIRIDADIADFWFDDSFQNLTVEANRRKFIDAAGKPVDLESDGAGPTGAAPLVYFSGATDAWHTNKGTGGGFTETGALTDGASSPSD